MKRIIPSTTQNFLLAILLFIFFITPSIQAETLHGTVLSAEDDSPLAGATIYLYLDKKGGVTDEKGNFTIANVTAGTQQIEVRYIGYRSKRKSITIGENGPTDITVRLQPYWFDQDEHEVTAGPMMSVAQYQPLQILNARDLQTRQAHSLGEMMEGEPGLTNRDFGSAPSRPVIRGFDGERLLILENGERMGDVQESAHDHAVTIDPLSIEEIETIRGPASLIYGSNAIGGVINMRTNNIPRTWGNGWEGQFAAQGATANQKMRTGIRLQHGGENMSYQGRFTFQNTGNTMTPIGELPGSGSEMYNAATGFAYKSPNRPFRGGLAVNWNRQEYGLPEIQAEEDPDNPDRFIEDLPEIILLMDRISLTGEAIWLRDGFFEAIELRTGLAYLDQEEREYEEDDFDLELHFLQHTLSSTLTMRHGQYGAIENGALGINVHAVNMEIGGDEAFHPGEKFIEASAFLFEEVRLSPQLVWQGGLRGGYRAMETTPNHLFTDFEESNNYVNLSGSTGLNYRVTENLETGVQVARAYRPPSVSELYASGWHAGAGQNEVGDPDLLPETSYGLDVFTKWQRNNFSAEITGFYNNLTNFIAPYELDYGCPDIDLVADGGPEYARCIGFRSVNAEMWGFETRFQYDMQNGLKFNLQTDMVNGTENSEESSPLPLIPPARIHSGVEFVRGNYEAAINLRAGLKQDRTAENELSTPAYAVPNFRIGYNITRNVAHRIILQVENPFNQTYYNHLSRVRRFPDPEAGLDAPERFPRTGRNFRLGYFANF